MSWAIRVDGLGKEYRIGATPTAQTFREMLMTNLKASVTRFGHARDKGRGTEERFWALKDVSFEVQEGEVIGVVGRNGAGKSTLLKILSRITDPTEGYADIRGRLGSLLEVGTGFHPELTGRENIYLNGSILGMRRAEITRRFDEIVAFAEVAKFLDTPVKWYSSGMYVRLAFAVAAHLDPEILLVDEVLAVGDAQFQKRCLGKVGEIARSGRSVLFVSHNMAAVEHLCHQGLWLDGGRVMRQGNPDSVIAEYLLLRQTVDDEHGTIPENAQRSGTGPIRLTAAYLLDAAGRRVTALRTGMDVQIALDYTSDGSEAKRVDSSISVHTIDGIRLFEVYRSFVTDPFTTVPERGTFLCAIPRLPLGPGRYELHARILVGTEESDRPRDRVLLLDVEPGDFFGTGAVDSGLHFPMRVMGTWDVVPR